MSDPTGLPPRRVEPLAPASGAFDAVLGVARARRHRRATAAAGITGVFIAGIMGGLAMGGSVGRVQGNLLQLANRGAPATQQASEQIVTRVASSTVPRAHRRTTRAKVSASAVAPVVPPPPSSSGPDASADIASAVQIPKLTTGRVVDAAGTAVAGLYVYSGTRSSKGFQPSGGALAVTDPDGHYVVPCLGGPLLLTPWPLGTPLVAAAEAAWSATFVRHPVCRTPATAAAGGGRGVAAQVTTVTAGLELTGVVNTDTECPGAELSLALRLDADAATVVRLAGLHAGDTYRIAGLPRGTHVLRAPGRSTTIVFDTEAMVQDVTLSCPPPTTASETPTTTPTSTDPASPTPTATTTGSTPTAASTTGTAPATPTPTTTPPLTPTP